jgi:phage FluMu gp28-like protein
MTTTMGIDLGRRHDSTAMIVVERNDEDEIIRVRAVRELKRIPFEAQIEEVKSLVRTYDPMSVSVDETGMGIPVVERMRQEIGSRIEGLTFTANSKAELVGRTVALLQDRKLKFGNYPRLREQLHSIRREITKDGNVLYRVDDAIGSGEGHADLAWALMLACHALRDTWGDMQPRDVAELFDAFVGASRRGPLDDMLSGDLGTGPRLPPPKTFDPRCPRCGASLRSTSHVKAHRDSGCTVRDS